MKRWTIPTHPGMRPDTREHFRKIGLDMIHRLLLNRNIRLGRLLMCSTLLLQLKSILSPTPQDPRNLTHRSQVSWLDAIWSIISDQIHQRNSGKPYLIPNIKIPRQSERNLAVSYPISQDGNFPL